MEEIKEENETEQSGSSLTSLLKSITLGANLNKTSLIPISFFFPKSFLQLYAEQNCKMLELLGKASSEPDSLQRFVYVLMYLIFSIGDYPNGKKPFNPVLGETFQGIVINEKEGNNPQSKNYASFVAEQIEHHPPTSALWISDDSFQLIFNLTEVASFWGNYLKIKNSGREVITLSKLQEIYEISRFPNLYFRFLSWRCEWSGKLQLSCPSTGYECLLHFKKKKMIGGSWDQVEGEIIESKSSKSIYKINGIWSKTISVVDSNSNEEIASYEASNFTSLSIYPKDEDENSSTKIWKKVIDALENEEYDKASEEKKKVENDQREKRNETAFKPKYFYFDDNTKLWTFNSSRS